MDTTVAMSITSKRSKVCAKCGQEKELLAFHVDRAQRDQRKTSCRLCVNKVKARWRARNRDRVLIQKRESYDRNREEYLAYNRSDRRRENVFRWKLERKFGITAEQFADMLEAQAGCCAICGELPSLASGHAQKHRLHVDHDHKSGRVRGLLCNTCNVGLGCFQDNIDKMLIAISYLEQANELQEEVK